MGKGRKPELTDWLQSDECNRIIELSKQGYSVGRIAEMTGIKKSRINYARRLKGFKSDRAFGTDGIDYKDSKFATHEVSQEHNQKTKQESESRLALFLLDKGLLYISGYDGRNSKVKVCCTVCGTTFTKYYDGHFKDRKTLECPFCEEKRLESKRQIKAERYQAYLELLNEWKSNREAKERANEERLDAKQVCKCCGKEFTLREYRTKEQTEHCEFTVYCSSKCRTKARNKALREINRRHGHERDHRKRATKYGCDYERGVTLKALIKRDGLRCAICGGECDLNDRSYGNGIGPLYPSMDHIIPMCKGGGHTWNNVQVAHHICNSRKNAKIDEKYGNVL